MQQRMTPFILFVWVLTCAIWSTVWLFIKLGVRDVPPAAFAVYRMAIALAVLVPVIVLRRTPLPRGRSEWTVILSTGFILLGVNYALLNWGIQYISSGLTAVLQAMTPVFGFVFVHLLLHDERMTVWKGLALLLGVAGVAIIFWDQMAAGGGRPLLGSIAVTVAAVCVAVAYVVMKRRGANLDPSVILVGQLLAGAVPLAVYSRIIEGSPSGFHWSRTALLSGLYLALLGSVAGGWLNYWLLKRIGATRLLSMGLIEPLIAVLLGAVFLGERLTIRTTLGGVSILVAVGVVLDVMSLRENTEARETTDFSTEQRSQRSERRARGAGPPGPRSARPDR
jgi:drug/metabolite transporter (DMT)-like permease